MTSQSKVRWSKRSFRAALLAFVLGSLIVTVGIIGVVSNLYKGQVHYQHRRNHFAPPWGRSELAACPAQLFCPAPLFVWQWQQAVLFFIMRSGRVSVSTPQRWFLSAVMVTFLCCPSTRAASPPAPRGVLELVKALRLFENPEATYETAAWNTMQAIENARRTGIAPEAALIHAFQHTNIPESLQPVSSDSLIRAYNELRNAAVFESSSEAPMFKTGHFEGRPVALRRVIPEVLAPEWASHPANLEATAGDVLEGTLWTPRSRALADLLAARQTPPDGPPAPVAPVPSADQEPTEIWNQIRLDAKFGEPFDLTPFGQNEVWFMLQSVSGRNVRYALLDGFPFAQRGGQRRDLYGTWIFEPFRNSRSFQVDRSSGMRVVGTLSRLILLYERPGILRIYLFDTLATANNRAALIIDWKEP